MKLKQIKILSILILIFVKNCASKSLDQIAQNYQTPVLIGGIKESVIPNDASVDPTIQSLAPSQEIIIPTPQEILNEIANTEKPILGKIPSKKIIKRKLKIEKNATNDLPQEESPVPFIPIVSTSLVGLAAEINGIPQTEVVTPVEQTRPVIDVSTNELNTVKPPNSRRLLFCLMLFVLVSVIGLLISVIFYRFHLSSEKRAPFTAPAILEFLFPKPVNYENEVTLLCMKYMQH